MIEIVCIIVIILIFAVVIQCGKFSTNRRMKNINNAYDELNIRIDHYNKYKTVVYRSLNDLYPESMDIVHSENLSLLGCYSDRIRYLYEEISLLDKYCGVTYNDKKIDDICNSYKIEYEKIVNLYVDDVNKYNGIIDDYNEKNNTKFEMFKSKFFPEYIDYDNDGIFSKIDEKERKY